MPKWWLQEIVASRRRCDHRKVGKKACACSVRSVSLVWCIEQLPDCWRIFPSLLERHKTFECLVHGDIVQLSQAPRLSAATECNHEANICPQGLQETLENAISEGRLQDIRCPDAECKAKYPVRDIRSIVSKESFAELVIDAPLSGYGSPLINI